MSRFTAVLAIVLCFLAFHAFPVVAADDTVKTQGGVTFKKDSLSVKTADGKTHNFSVDIAETQEQREQGLKNHKGLSEDQGMLFIFEEDTYVQMWMKDSFTSLDILFLDSKGKVIYIAAKTKINSTDIISAKRDARGVLEILAGVAEKKGIKVGDQVVYPYFKP